MAERYAPSSASSIHGGPASHSPSMELSKSSTQGHGQATAPEASPLQDSSIEHGPSDLVVEQPPLVPASVQTTSLSLGVWLDHVAVMSHLAFFGIVGVLIRYGLEILFGPEVAQVTDDNEALFIDIPANMAGSFLMGWVGVVVKRDIVGFSEPLAVGLSTGLCGSITTFASWNQRMLAISASGLWVGALAGYVIGGQLSLMSLVVGIDSATAFLALLGRWDQQRSLAGRPPRRALPPDNLDRRWGSLLFFFGGAALLCVGAAAGTAVDSCLKRRRVWLALLVSPFGVWIRWYLARLNGRGLGKRQLLKWIPLGTFVTNVVASSLEALISTVNLAVDTRTSAVISGALQLGLLGCMSTVSTFVVEVRTLRMAPSAQWRAYAYYLLSLAVAFIIGLLVYSIPVWKYNYLSRYNRLESC